MSLRALVTFILVLSTPALAQLPARLPRAPQIDAALVMAGVPLAIERHGLRGRGATLCLIDTGVDASHPDLRNAEGSRARWLLDRTAPPRGGFPALEREHGGAVYRAEELDDPLAPGDAHGHGTAMASIALGSDAEWTGVAPAASLIVVRAYDRAAGGFHDEDVVAGVRFCRAIAAEDEGIDPARLVILLALGGHDGAHDGQGAFERAIVREAGGVPVVTAIGNDGDRGVHARARLFGGESTLVELRIPSGDALRPRVVLTVEAEARGTLSIEAPSGTRTPPLALDRAQEITLEDARVTITPSDRRGTSYLAIEGARGTYGLRLHGPSLFEVWLARVELGATLFAAELAGARVVHDGSITIPATASELISVGAIVSRERIETRGAELAIGAGAGERAPFSPLGPSPRGVPCPDLVAPGGFVVAAASSDLAPFEPNLVGGDLDRFHVGEARLAVRGTSVAAAIVAGAILLAMERAPDRDLAALVAATARGEGWSAEAGAGALDTAALLDALERPAAGDALLTLATSRSRYLATDGSLWVVARARSAGGDLGQGILRIWIGGALEGAIEEAEVELAGGIATLALPAPPRATGSIVTLHAAFGDQQSSLQLPVALESDHDVVLAGGACATSPARASWWPLVAIVSAARAGRRRPARRGR